MRSALFKDIFEKAGFDCRTGDAMRGVLTWLAAEPETGVEFALATVVSASGSVPLPVGSSMAVTRQGHVFGGVSGGCIDADVYARAEEVLATGIAQLTTYSPSVDVGNIALTCGGEIQVLVERVCGEQLRLFKKASAAVLADKAVCSAVITRSDDPGRVGLRQWLIDGEACGGTSELLGVVVSASSAAESVGLWDAVGSEAFATVLPPRPRMLIFGMSPFVAAMCEMGRMLGYTVSVCDPRGAFMERARFSAANEILIEEPATYLRNQLAAGRVDERTVILAMTHSGRFDTAVIADALRGECSPAFIGALGSAATARERKQALKELGIPPDRVDRVSMPVGLPLGGRTPREVAVAIAAELIAATRGKRGAQPAMRVEAEN
ncbi:XdhC family protein [Hoyosella subflava]|uniref:Xanthine dehydrogenase n=1 Tax=Hoyosella subflava (strain DSM 45089 / JCM 17490 / NBRC 109087 / DQS3-9A1) TaxID=443218 RepID=F6EM16_HOYSD|nr:XdhC family protein [Hoyosella subflava]AEF42797.1 xanthine dehydrogenase [Hoyosella subflava DQS3-9A1]